MDLEITILKTHRHRADLCLQREGRERRGLDWEFGVK